MEAGAYLAERSRLVDARLDALLPKADEPPVELHAAMRHLVFPGGKRLRPALAIAAGEAFGAAPERALPPAVAVELLHTYSLIHDDLPCMDDDAVRRGRPTVHVRYGEATALLAGDALFALAFEALATPPDPREDAAGALEPARVAEGVRELARAAGARQLVGGQAADLAIAAGGPPPDAAAIESVHERKSAALIAASICGGARFAGANQDWLSRLWDCGREVGVAFQIADDRLDREDDEGCSLVRAIGDAEAAERAEVLLGRALQRLEGLGEAADPLRELLRFAVRRDR